MKFQRKYQPEEFKKKVCGTMKQPIEADDDCEACKI